MRFWLGFTGFCWVLAWFYLVLLSFKNFYLILPDFTGFYWVLLGFTEWHRVWKVFFWPDAMSFKRVRMGLSGFERVRQGWTEFSLVGWKRNRLERQGAPGCGGFFQSCHRRVCLRFVAFLFFFFGGGVLQRKREREKEMKLIRRVLSPAVTSEGTFLSQLIGRNWVPFRTATEPDGFGHSFSPIGSDGEIVVVVVVVVVVVECRLSNPETLSWSREPPSLYRVSCLFVCFFYRVFLFFLLGPKGITGVSNRYLLSVAFLFNKWPSFT